MQIKRTGSASWSGGLKDGRGTVSSESGALDAHPYGFQTRFEGVKGTNPEELIGAAHASCFTMALSLALEEAGFKADRMDTSAKVQLEKVSDGFSVTKIDLVLDASIPGIDDGKFQEIAAKAKAGCPISKLLDTEITLSATLKG